MCAGPLQDAPQIPQTAVMIEAQTELSQLQRDVPRDARRDNRIDNAQVLARGGLGRFEGRGALAEVVERNREATGFYGPCRRDGLFERFARDKSARSEDISSSR